MVPRTSPSTHAFTLVEIMVALTLGGVLLTVLSSLHSFTIREAREQREVQAVTIGLQERLDQIRAQTWAEIRYPKKTREILGDTNLVPVTNQLLKSLSETVKVQNHAPLGLNLPVVLPSDNWTLTKGSDGAISGSPDTFLVGGLVPIALQVTVTFSWTSGTRIRTRSLTTLVTFNALTK